MATFNVGNSAQLIGALSQAKAGDQVLMAAGNYGTLKLDGATASAAFARFGGEVTIRSADANRPAVLTSLDLDNVSNLTFDGVKFDLVAGSAGGFNPFSVNRSSKVTIRNGEFDGQLVDGYGVNQGLQVKKSTDITVENSTFSNFYYGAGFDEVSNLKFVGNELTGMAFDGTRFAQIVGGTIAGNHYHDMRAPGNSAHRDMIQFWTHGDTIPSSNVTIRDNVITIDDNYRVQSIFIYNEQVTRQGDGKAMYYKNFVIEDNYIEGNHPHGIFVGPIDGLLIRGNTVVRDPDNPHSGSGWHPKIEVDPLATRVTITGNTASEIKATASGSTVVSGNTIVAPGHQPTGPGAGPQPVDPPPVVTPPVEPPPPSQGAGQTGTAGDDSLAGTAGNEVLRGLAGNDRLHGGAGRDVLIGGSGDDVFVFRASSDSHSAGHDVVRGGDGGRAFEGAGGAGGDRVDLSAIDANALVAGDQAFVLGSAEAGGFVLIDMPSSNTLLRANTDGDARFEFELIVEDAGVRASQYGAADFVL